MKLLSFLKFHIPYLISSPRQTPYNITINIKKNAKNILNMERKYVFHDNDNINNIDKSPNENKTMAKMNDVYKSYNKNNILFIS